MDPLKHFLRTEGCSSSESGWTRYLVSPMQDDSECSEDNYNNNHNTKNNDDDDDDDDGEGNSDDSMVSDASSAPTHHQYKHIGGRGSHSNAHLKHDKGDYSSKHSSRKEAKKEVKKSAENSGKSKKRLRVGGQPKYRK
ncbi:serine/threonine-protein kinase rio2-like [Durio zibethinus]|uniref:Serine/threonine-protein kinase rio2-like n=1 Tax=Durio zibethinus TaxID=66656 RepID=A0A6P6A5B4_DURZI|nr:serine/threonine-protein kinase rio2-like [Durio zibethinus]